jgi:hypothetical protein
MLNNKTKAIGYTRKDIMKIAGTTNNQLKLFFYKNNVLPDITYRKPNGARGRDAYLYSKSLSKKIIKIIHIRKEYKRLLNELSKNKVLKKC